MRGSSRIVLGGTFDRLHVGHEAMLATAFRAGRRVAIGLTSTRYLARHSKPDAARIQSYTARRAALSRWLARRYARSRWTIVPIDDAFGGSVEDGVSGLVVSADTIEGGRAVNAERVRRGRSRVPVLVVPLVLADDLEPVSSRRIRAGGIDRRGRRLAPIAIGLAAGTTDRRAAARAVAAVFRRARILALPESPARQRYAPREHASRAATAALRRGAIGIGIVTTGARRWVVAIRTRRVELAPCTVVGDLETGLVRLLQPSRRRKPF